MNSRSRRAARNVPAVAPVVATETEINSSEEKITKPFTDNEEVSSTTDSVGVINKKSQGRSRKAPAKLKSEEPEEVTSLPKISAVKSTSGRSTRVNKEKSVPQPSIVNSGDSVSNKDVPSELGVTLRRSTRSQTGNATNSVSQKVDRIVVEKTKSPVVPKAKTARVTKASTKKVTFETPSKSGPRSRKQVVEDDQRSAASTSEVSAPTKNTKSAAATPRRGRKAAQKATEETVKPDEVDTDVDALITNKRNTRRSKLCC